VARAAVLLYIMVVANVVAAGIYLLTVLFG